MPSFGREVKLLVPCRIYGTLKSLAVSVEVVTDKAKVAGHFSPEAFLPR
jgi:hypothetical protein